jgi:WD40 repeat protein
VAALYGNNVGLRRLTRLQQVELEGHEAQVTSCAISPEGLFFVSGSEDRTLRIGTTSLVSSA